MTTYFDGLRWKPLSDYNRTFQIIISNPSLDSLIEAYENEIYYYARLIQRWWRKKLYKIICYRKKIAMMSLSIAMGVSIQSGIPEYIVNFV